MIAFAPAVDSQIRRILDAVIFAGLLWRCWAGTSMAMGGQKLTALRGSRLSSGISCVCPTALSRNLQAPSQAFSASCMAPLVCSTSRGARRSLHCASEVRPPGMLGAAADRSPVTHGAHKRGDGLYLADCVLAGFVRDQPQELQFPGNGDSKVSLTHLVPQYNSQRVTFDLILQTRRLTKGATSLGQTE